MVWFDQQVFVLEDMEEVLLISRFMTRTLILLSLCFMWVPPGVVCRTGNASASSSSSSSSSLKPKVINIGSLFTLNSVIGRAARPALQAAIDDVNADPTILNGVELKLVLHDTNCSSFVGTVEGIFFYSAI